MDNHDTLLTAISIVIKIVILPAIGTILFWRIAAFFFPSILDDADANVSTYAIQEDSTDVNIDNIENIEQVIINIYQ